MTARLYTRVSTIVQAEEGYSLAGQRAKLLAYCSANGLTDTQLYEDAGLSGTREDRPDLQRLLADLRAGDTVLVYSLSRLGRGGVAQTLTLVEAIRAKGARLVSLTESIDTESPTGRAMLGMFAVLAQLEIEITRERADLGRAEAAARGIFPHASRALPTGYSRGPDGVAVEDEEADLVRLAFRLAPGRTLRELARELETHGYRKLPVSLRQLLERECYHTGVLHYRSRSHPNDPAKWVELPVPPLVTRDEWQAAQRTRSSHHGARRADLFVLTGHLRCACGAPLTGYLRKNAGGTRSSVYRCSQPGRLGAAVCPATGKSAPTWPASRVDANAKRALAALFRDPLGDTNLASAYRTRPVEDPHAVERAEVRRKLGTLATLLLDEMIDRETYDARYTALKAREAALAPPPPPAPALVPDLSEFAEEIEEGISNENLADLLDLFEVRLQADAGGEVRVIGFRPVRD